MADQGDAAALQSLLMSRCSPTPSRAERAPDRRAARRARSLLPAARERRPSARRPPRRQPGRRLQRLPTLRAVRAPAGRDSGAFLLADAYGAERTIYVKDVDGVYTRDPVTSPDGEAELITRVGASELLAMDLPSLPIDRLVLELMSNAKHVQAIQIVNGLTRGNVTQALRGEHVGTLIHADARE